MSKLKLILNFIKISLIMSSSTINFSVLEANNTDSFPVLYIEETTKTVQNSFEQHTVKKSYFSENYALIHDQSLPYRVLFDYPKETVYVIDDRSRTFSELSIKYFRELSMQNPMSQMNNNDFLVDQKKKTTKISGYTCTEIAILMPKIGMKTTAYVSKMNYSMDLYFRFLDKTKLGGNISKLSNLYREISGYAVLTSTLPVSTMAPKITSDVRLTGINLSKRSVSIFKIPGDYAKKTLR